jgi:hypothetical protein
MPADQARSQRNVALTFADLKHARIARRIYSDERYGQYLGLPDSRTVVIREVDLEWLVSRLEKEGYRTQSDYKVSQVLRMGDLPSEETAQLKRRKLVSEKSSETISALLKRAKERHVKLRSQRVK